MLFALSLTGCSTAHVHKYLQFDGSESKTESQARTTHPYPIAHYDEVIVDLEGAKIYLALRSEYVIGTDLVGPLLIPIIPISLGNPKIKYTTLDLQVSSLPGKTVDLDLNEVTLTFDGGKAMKPTMIQALSQIFAENKTGHYLRFEFDSQPFPEHAVIALNGVKLNGTSQKPILLNFKENAYWHYVPFTFMHTD